MTRFEPAGWSRWLVVWVGLWCVAVPGCAPAADGTDARSGSGSKGDALGDGRAILRVVHQASEGVSFCGEDLSAELLASAVHETTALLRECMGDGDDGHCWHLLAADGPKASKPGEWDWGLALGWPADQDEGRALRDLLMTDVPLDPARENRFQRALRDYVHVPEPKKVVAGLSRLFHAALFLRKLAGAKPIHPYWILLHNLIVYAAEVPDWVEAFQQKSGSPRLPDSVRYLRALAAAGRAVAALRSGSDPFGGRDAEKIAAMVQHEILSDGADGAPYPAYQLHRDSEVGRDVLGLLGEAAAHITSDLFAVTLTVLYPTSEGVEVAPRSFADTTVQGPSGDPVSLPVVSLVVDLTAHEFLIAGPGLRHLKELGADRDGEPVSATTASPCQGTRVMGESCVAGHSLWAAVVDPAPADGRQGGPRGVIFRPAPWSRPATITEDRGNGEIVQELDQGTPMPPRAVPSQPLTCAMASPWSRQQTAYNDDVREVLGQGLVDIFNVEQDRMDEGDTDSLVGCAEAVDIMQAALRRRVSSATGAVPPALDRLDRMLERMETWIGNYKAGNQPSKPTPDLDVGLEGPVVFKAQPLPRGLTSRFELDLELALFHYRDHYYRQWRTHPTPAEGDDRYRAAVLLACQDEPDEPLFFAADGYVDSRGWPVVVNLWNLGPLQIDVSVEDVDYTHRHSWRTTSGVGHGEHHIIAPSRGDNLHLTRLIRLLGVTADESDDAWILRPREDVAIFDLGGP